VNWRRLPVRLALIAVGLACCWFTLFYGSVVPEIFAVGFFALVVVPAFWIYADWINGGPDDPDPPPAGDS
jgi:nitroreductase